MIQAAVELRIFSVGILHKTSPPPLSPQLGAITSSQLHLIQSAQEEQNLHDIAIQSTVPAVQLSLPKNRVLVYGLLEKEAKQRHRIEFISRDVLARKGRGFSSAAIAVNIS